jgi:hypothetical protein
MSSAGRSITSVSVVKARSSGVYQLIRIAAPIFRLKPEATSAKQYPWCRTISVVPNNIRGFRLQAEVRRATGQ